jgi:hypothetical protein
MKQETQELKDIPLSFLISAPLNAAIQAQRDAAMSTAAFIETVGFIPKGKPSLFSNNTGNTGYDVRQVKVGYKQDEIKLLTQGNPNANPPTKDVYQVTSGVERTLQLPFISMLNIPMFEVSELNIDFNVRLKGATQFEAEFNTDNTTTVGAGGNAGGDLASLGIPVSVGAHMNVESTTRTQFGLRYGEGHEAEYNLHVTVKAIQAPPPKGIERLLSLAEKIVDASERANAERLRLNAPGG